MLSIDHIVCTNNVNTVKYTYQLGNGGNTPKIQVSVMLAKCQPCKQAFLQIAFSGPLC